MHKKISYIIPMLLLVIGIISLGFIEEYGDKNKLKKTDTNDNYNFISINQCFMWVANNGDGSNDPRTGGSGFYWPGGINATITAIFEDGLIFAGMIGSEVRMNGNTHRQGLQAGKILPSGEADDPSLDKYRVYKIRKGWEELEPGFEIGLNQTREDLETDYNEWPVEDGAPWVDVDGDGVFTRGVDTPEFIGDEVLWYVANDMDASRSTFTYGTLPMGLEFQTAIFAFNRTGDLGDIVFKKYLIINKGTNTITEMYLGYWSDTDLGEANDDFTGCDTLLSLGYTWNGDNNDEDFYGANPPANGYDFFQGPIVPGNPDDRAKFQGEWREGFRNLPMTAFTLYINPGTVYRDPLQGVAEGSIEFYNYLKGYVWNGDPFIDPNLGVETKYAVAGDPVNKTGWYEGEGWPGGPAPKDRRHLMASGPFTMAPGDTQEVVIGILIGRGSSNIKSIKELKIKDQAAQFAYDVDFNLPPSPAAPKLHANALSKSVTLWWEDNAEVYDNDFYTFEGYRIWQYRDLTGTDPEPIGIYDIVNDVAVIEDFVVVNDERVKAPVIVANNTGLLRTVTIATSIYNNAPLVNANPYYFAVTAYARAKNPLIIPQFLENPAQIIEVFPGRNSIDTKFTLDPGDTDVATQIGTGDGTVSFQVIDPSVLTGNTYTVMIDSTVVNDTTGEKALSYSLYNKTTGDTLITQSRDFSVEIEEKFILDGFALFVSNEGGDSIATSLVASAYRVHDVLEINGPGGTVLDNPVNVWQNSNSTSNWSITGPGATPRLNWLAGAEQNLGFEYYELRFTGTSQYYASGWGGGFKPLFRDDFLGKGTLPFEVWMMDRQLNDIKRLPIKIQDRSLGNDSTLAIPDSQFTKLADGTWEEVYVFDSTYSGGALPPMSGATSPNDYFWGTLKFEGELPEAGTVIRITTFKSLDDNDSFEFIAPAADFNDKTAAKDNIDKISVFPNPYLGANQLETNKYQRFVRFTGLPDEATIRIFTLSGVFIRKFDKDDPSQYLDWDLLNSDALPVASGIYLAYLDMPGIGTKILKLAIIQEQQYIDRL